MIFPDAAFGSIGRWLDLVLPVIQIYSLKFLPFYCGIFFHLVHSIIRTQKCCAFQGLIMQDAKPTVTELAGQIVSAYVSNHRVAARDLPDLIADVAAAMKDPEAEKLVLERPEPAVPIKKSVFTEYIVCLEDGKKFKMLKRHLEAVYGMTPQQYRERWGLPEHYPMVASAYASRRSELAKSFGLGKLRGDR